MVLKQPNIFNTGIKNTIEKAWASHRKLFQNKYPLLVYKLTQNKSPVKAKVSKKRKISKFSVKKIS